jgi:hypothetical protein
MGPFLFDPDIIQVLVFTAPLYHSPRPEKTGRGLNRFYFNQRLNQTRQEKHGE